MAEIPWSNRADRWLACIDLLGFGRAVRVENWSTISRIYETALDVLSSGPGNSSNVGYAWFSDTFMFYSDGSSNREFSEVELRARSFCQTLVEAGIPLRGAMTCGQFIPYKEQNVFVGPALVEAYRQCEDQNWVGFSMTPSAADQIQSVPEWRSGNFPYRYWDVPRNTGNSPSAGLLSLLLGGDRLPLEKNPCYVALRQMEDESSKDHIRAKYRNAITFLEKFVGNPSNK